MNFHQKMMVNPSVRPHITAMWTPLNPQARLWSSGKAPNARKSAGQPKSRVGSNPTRGAFSGSHFEAPKILENREKRPKSTQIHILFFGASGTGKIVREDF